MSESMTGRTRATGWTDVVPIAVWAFLAAIAVWFARSRPEGCPGMRWRAYTAGSDHDFDGAIQLCEFPLQVDARAQLILLGIVFVALTATLAPILHVLWPRSWRARPFSEWTWVWVLPAAAAILGTAATINLAVGTSTTPLTISDDAARAVAGFAWPAAIMALVATVLAAFTLLASIGSSGVSRKPADGETWSPDPIDGLGVCVSGGGIRAAAFALGGLAYLERHDRTGQEAVGDQQSVLDEAKYLASVSGGGYTAGAWRVARGTATECDPWPNRVFGDLTAERLKATEMPDRAFDEKIGQDDGVFSHMWARREFLRTGRGGLLVSAVMFLISMVLQLALLAAFVSLVAWPLGMLARSFPILGAEFHGADPYEFAIRQRSVWPVVYVGFAALLVIVARSFMHRTKIRLALDGLVAVLVGAATVLAAVLIGLPLAIEFVSDIDAAGVAITTLFAAGGVAITAGKVLAKVIKPKLILLGGVLFAAAAAIFGLLVSRAAAVPGGALVGRTGWYWLLVVFFVFAWSYGDPRWWSLFPMYRNRIRSAFGVTRNPDRAARRTTVSPGIYPMSRRNEPSLDEYQGAPGPQHLVCCSVARANRTGTGVPALSFVFGPDDVRFYESVPGFEIKVHRVPTEQYVGALERRVLTGWPCRRPKSLGTVSAAVAMSGAAVTSAMGRSNVGTTNSLIAGLNVRLGAWVPNPRHIVTDERPAKRARVNYLVKELMGWYDLADPHVYVTDGGHWDNLGLVELLRRRCETIVCIDTSGDPPGSFATLHQALDLALVECRATIDFTQPNDGADGHGEPVSSFDAMRAALPYRPATSSAVGTITYFDNDGDVVGNGRVLFVKAQVSAEHDPAVVAYSFEDPLFPNYSTADQFLGAEQFRMLVRLGWESMSKALPKLSPADEGASADTE